MRSTDDRAAGQPGAGEVLPAAAFEHARAERAATAQRMAAQFRRNQARLLETVAAVAATETSVARTFHDRAEQALRVGRLDDARRLEGVATAALRAAQQEGQRDEVSRRHDNAAQRRDDAAYQRDEAAQRRDDAARQRDDWAVSRAVAAGRRRVAADDRQTDEEQWADRADGSKATSEPADEQSDVDAQVRATRRGLDENHRQRAAADRGADMDDRAAADLDRRAAAEDRKIARADREAAARDRTAAQADREQAAIDRETRY